jgi:cell division transport system permease protein
VTLSTRLNALLPAGLRTDTPVARIVPPSGGAVRLVWTTSAAMAFLAVLALALALAAGRVADRWEAGLAGTATVRINAPPDQMAEQVQAAIRVLQTTPGVVVVREMSSEDRKALLAPWIGSDLALDALPLPAVLEVVERTGGVDGQGLRLRLAAEVPGAVYDDHGRWRRPLVQTAQAVRLAGLAGLMLIAGLGAGMVALATQAALQANMPVIRTLRLIGARDAFIARAFVRRFTLRTAGGALIGAAVAGACLGLAPTLPLQGGFGSLGLSGIDWLWPVLVPVVAAAVAFATARATAFRLLRGLP